MDALAAVVRHLTLKAAYDRKMGDTRREAHLPRATDAPVDHAAGELGVTFPPSDRKFVTSTCLQCYEEILRPARKKNPFSIVPDGASSRQSLLGFMAPGDGDQVYFDMPASDHGDEFPIVAWHHDVDYDDPEDVIELDQVAANFGEYRPEYPARIFGDRPDAESPG